MNDFTSLGAAELFVSVFHSFKAGIAKAISRFKRRRKIHFWKIDIELFD